MVSHTDPRRRKVRILATLGPASANPEMIHKLYLAGALEVLGSDLHYIKEVVSGNHAVLEFISIVDGLQVNGIDMISFDDQSSIWHLKSII